MFAKSNIIHEIERVGKKCIGIICLLKDKRLVSAFYNLIVVYDYSYKPKIYIKGGEDEQRDSVRYLCALRGGELVSASFKEIKIWKINENDYQLIHTLKEHTDWVNKVIELEDGKLCSCSDDQSIRIWNNKNSYSSYHCIQFDRNQNSFWGTLKFNLVSIIEMNNYIISTTNENELIMFDKSTYQTISTIHGVSCYSKNGLLKMNSNTLLLGYYDALLIVDIQTCEFNKIKDEYFGTVDSVSVLENDKVLIGNEDGELICYELSSDQFIFKNQFYDDSLTWFIKTEDNKIILPFPDGKIYIYNI